MMAHGYGMKTKRLLEDYSATRRKSLRRRKPKPKGSRALRQMVKAQPENHHD